jgi:hypothetical protein
MIVEAEVAGQVPEAAADLHPMTARVEAEQPHGPRVGSDQVQQHPDGRGLARPVRAQKGEDLPGQHFEIDVFNSAGAPVAFGDILHAHRQRHRRAIHTPILDDGAPVFLEA